MLYGELALDYDFCETLCDSGGFLLGEESLRLLLWRVYVY